jgi:hypothetical protein
VGHLIAFPAIPGEAYTKSRFARITALSRYALIDWSPLIRRTSGRGCPGWRLCRCHV